MSFGRECTLRFAVSPAPPYLLASEALTLAILEKRARVNIEAISFPVDTSVSEKEIRCMFLSGEGVITSVVNHSYLTIK